MSVIIDGSAGVTTNAGGLVNPSTTIDGINYSCRAWVNFNGTGTPAIRASGNVTNITDNAVGDYTVNITTAMTDANYSVALSCAMFDTGNNSSTVLIYGSLAGGASGKTSSALRIRTGQPQTTSFHDNAEVNVAIFR